MTRERAIEVLKAWNLNWSDEFTANEFEQAFDMAISALENKGEWIPDTATNEDVMNETLRRVFPKTLFIRSRIIANKTQAINMSDEWLGRNYKEMYK